MARKIRWFKVGSIPTVWQPDSVYIIEDGSYGEGYVTDVNGVPKELGNSTMINELINIALAGAGISHDTYTGIAGETLGGGKLVYLDTGKFYLYNANNTALADKAFGIAKTAAAVNTSVNIQVNGVFTEVGLGLIPDSRYYAGLTGLLSLTANSTVNTQIGIAIDADHLRLEIQPSIITI